ncbi:hypothetical protein GGQ69_001292 [Micrococcus sp. TA1]|nr:hypothetical protein [Micrococcus sp. TA1]
MTENPRQERRIEALVLCIVGFGFALSVAAVNALFFPGESFWDNLQPGVGFALGLVLAYPILKWRARRKR